MTVWFTADQHFGHARLLELSAARGAAFASVTEMNARLITSWNTVDAPDDTVYVLGDFDMHGKDATLAFVGPLAGTKILISGNHDSCWGGVRDGWKSRDLYLAAGFAAVMDFAVTTLPPIRPPATRVLLSHFPYSGDSGDEDRYAQFRLRLARRCPRDPHLVTQLRRRRRQPALPRPGHTQRPAVSDTSTNSPRPSGPGALSTGGTSVSCRTSTLRSSSKV